MSAGRWLCNKCGLRFAVPEFSIVQVKLPLEGGITDTDPSLPHGQVNKYFCPPCGAGDLVGSANPDPFTPIQGRRN